MSTAIVWFRRDLRCHDNPALTKACAKHKYVIPLYIAEPSLSLGEAQNWWLHHSLKNLEKNLARFNLKLCLKRGKALDVLVSLIETFKVDSLYWNRCYEPQDIERDQDIKQRLKEKGLPVLSFNASFLNEPWEVLTQTQGFFKVFTPYWRQALKRIQVQEAFRLEGLSMSPESLPTDNLNDWHLLPKVWGSSFAHHWQPGEDGALERLNHFCQENLKDYHVLRDNPWKNATSGLSPHLHFGEVSPWELWRRMKTLNLPEEDIQRFLTQLGWRDFSTYLLYHYPTLATEEFKAHFKNFNWRENPKKLQAWQKGLTGYPIVDAGMRELWQTGFMHNRVRMIVASFLVKDLLIDWRKGAEWFFSTLLDADLANNSASWQWVAGCGVDAAPYFRIFNPILQGETFDPKGLYVKQFLPELREVPDKWIHKPWEAPELPITLGKDYPYPIVDHKEARLKALELYAKLNLG